MSQQETGKVRLAKEHDPGLWILEAQVSGERGSEDKIADEFRLEDENRAYVRGYPPAKAALREDGTVASLRS
ncbi:hypothetical protein [Mesorhizobium sp. M0684]|uniref:hypothetical protein n=1 Tax=Mesorhizobium sp. M0684 TaxID=2956986 RepID=UPI00333DFBFA